MMFQYAIAGFDINEEQWCTLNDKILLLKFSGEEVKVCASVSTDLYLY